jgi:biotin transporter BioY
MYIIVIAWLYVVILMAATEKTVAAGLLTFIFYGLIPCALLLWILGAKHRRHYRNKQLLEQDVREPDRSATQADQ